MHGTRPLTGWLQWCYGACRGGVMQHAGYELPRILIPRTTVNKGRKKRERTEALAASALSAVAATL
jgi:hypothetical protein